jgi:hypothetical protein
VGKQRRNAAFGRLFTAGFLALAGVASLVYGVLELTGSIGNGDDAAQRAGAIIGGALGLFFLALGWFVFRQARSPALAGFAIELERPSLRRGETVEATVTLADPAAVTPETEVGLVCIEHHEVRTRGQNGSHYPATREDVAFEEWHELAPALERQSFSFVLPASGPYSHEGSVLSFEWRVSVRERQRLRADARSDAPLTVAP